MIGDVAVHRLRKRVHEDDLYADLSFTAEGGAITAFFGPNGCGKSTLLNILAGIASKDGGTTSSNCIQPSDFSYLFQNYRESLLPWRSNNRNIAFPLELQGMDPSAIRARITALADAFGINFDLERHPYQLSGGQQQTLALLRALAPEPSLLFMDEPFSALDYENSMRMRMCLQEYYLRKKPTILFVSHDIEEAVHMASSIVVLSKHPTSVVEIIRNPAPYPRPIQVLQSAEFHLIKNKVLTAFQSVTCL